MPKWDLRCPIEWHDCPSCGKHLGLVIGDDQTNICWRCGAQFRPGPPTPWPWIPAREIKAVSAQTYDRRAALGSSEIAPVLGLSPWRSALDIWRGKVEGTVDGPDSPAMRRGRFLEAAILSRHEKEIGEALTRDVVVTNGWRRAQIDALSRAGVVEAKTVSTRSYQRDEWGEPGTDQIPDAYLCQTLWQCDLAEVASAAVVVAVLPDDPDLVLGLTADEVLANCRMQVYRVDLRADLVVEIVARCRAFWTLVESKTPPPPSSYQEAASLWSPRVGTSVVATDDARAWIFALQAARRIGNAAHELEDRAKFRLAEILQDREAIVGPDGSPWLVASEVERKGYEVKASKSRTMRTTKWWARTPESAQAEQAALLVQSVVPAKPKEIGS